MPPQLNLFTKFPSRASFLNCCSETESLISLTKALLGVSASVETETLAIGE
jgi:hypothetical protein